MTREKHIEFEVFLWIDVSNQSAPMSELKKEIKYREEQLLCGMGYTLRDYFIWRENISWDATSNRFFARYGVCKKSESEIYQQYQNMKYETYDRQRKSDVMPYDVID
jgi:hypothetical protein